MYCDSDDECYNKNKASNNDGTKYDEDDTVTAQQRGRDFMYKRGRGSSTVRARRFNLSAQIKCGFSSFVLSPEGSVKQSVQR